MSRIRLLLRGLLIQASWNPVGFQNLGFAWAILPELKRMYGKDPEKLKEAVLRQLEFFQCHPCTSPTLLAMAVCLEEEGQGERAAGMKRLLSGPFSAIGDELFWHGLRPLLGCAYAAGLFMAVFWLFNFRRGDVGSLAAAGLLLGPSALFLAVYNLVHLRARVRFLELGCRLDRSLRLDALQMKIRRWTRFMRGLGQILILLALATFVAIPILQIAPHRTEWGLALVVFGFGVFIAKKWPEWLAASAAAAAAAFFSLLFRVL